MDSFRAGRCVAHGPLVPVAYRHRAAYPLPMSWWDETRGGNVIPHLPGVGVECLEPMLLQLSCVDIARLHICRREWAIVLQATEFMLRLMTAHSEPWPLPVWSFDRLKLVLRALAGWGRRLGIGAKAYVQMLQRMDLEQPVLESVQLGWRIPA